MKYKIDQALELLEKVLDDVQTPKNIEAAYELKKILNDLKGSRGDEVIFSLNVADFDGIAGRELTEDEIDTCISKFSIESWPEYVEIFLSSRGIE